MRKKTLEEVKILFESRNYILLENEYKHSGFPMKYQCPKHPDKELKIAYSNLKNGQGCKYCGGESRNNKTKNDFETVESVFNKKGYILLESEYINAKTPMLYICPNHPDKETKITYNSIRQGKGCGYCATENHGDKIRYSYEEVKNEFEKRGYKLLSKSYTDSKKRLEYQCLIHQEITQTISFCLIKRGHGCKLCATEKLKSKIVTSYNDVKLEFEKRGYELITKEYKRNDQKLRFLCPRHPNEKTTITYGSLKSGHGCYYCGKELQSKKMSGENSPKWKGGITNLGRYLRNQIKPWINDSMKAGNYKCVITGEGSYEVHHLQGFEMILNEVIKDTGIDIKEKVSFYSKKELRTLKKKCLETHYKYPLGVCLREDIHELFHKLYGRGGNTPEQFDEFKSRFLSGEFNTSIWYNSKNKMFQ